MSFKGIMQARKTDGSWWDVMPFVGNRSYLAVAHASKVLGCSVRVREVKDETPDGGGDVA